MQIGANNTEKTLDDSDDSEWQRQSTDRHRMQQREGSLAYNLLEIKLPCKLRAQKSNEWCHERWVCTGQDVHTPWLVFLCIYVVLWRDSPMPEYFNTSSFPLTKLTPCSRVTRSTLWKSLVSLTLIPSCLTMSAYKTDSSQCTLNSGSVWMAPHQPVHGFCVACVLSTPLKSQGNLCVWVVLTHLQKLVTVPCGELIHGASHWSSDAFERYIQKNVIVLHMLILGRSLHYAHGPWLLTFVKTDYFSFTSHLSFYLSCTLLRTVLVQISASPEWTILCASCTFLPIFGMLFWTVSENSLGPYKGTCLIRGL